MPNGHVMQTTLLFDTLLYFAWQRAMERINKAAELTEPEFNAEMQKTADVYSLPRFDPGQPQFSLELQRMLADYDQGVAAQLRELNEDWSNTFFELMGGLTPVSASFNEAVRWYARVVAGQQALGYVGRDHRLAQSAAAGQQALQGAVALHSLLPMPAGAGAALQRINTDLTSLSHARLAASLGASDDDARMKLRIEAIADLVSLRNQVQDACRDYVFAQMSYMFEVYGDNNTFLTKYRRDALLQRTALGNLANKLGAYETQVAELGLGTADGQRVVAAANERTVTKAQMLIEDYLKRIRREASKASAALNGVGVSVNSGSSERNTVDANE